MAGRSVSLPELCSRTRYRDLTYASNEETEDVRRCSSSLSRTMNPMNLMNPTRHSRRHYSEASALICVRSPGLPDTSHLYHSALHQPYLDTCMHEERTNRYSSPSADPMAQASRKDTSGQIKGFCTTADLESAKDSKDTQTTSQAAILPVSVDSGWYLPCFSVTTLFPYYTHGNVVYIGLCKFKVFCLFRL